MLNEKNQRELAYIVRIDDIKPIDGKDRVECAVVGGWTVMVRKGQFKAGDLGIYFEIDSKVPEKEVFEFLASKHYKIKTQGYKTPSGKFYSQGLLMSAEDFGGLCYQDGDGQSYLHFDNNSYFGKNVDYKKGEFLTEVLGVTYSVAEDNKRKAPSVDKYKKMAARHPKLFQKPLIKWLYKQSWGKRVLFFLFGKKKDTRTWPVEVKKTDEERIENRPWILNEREKIWIATEKIDGSSATFHLRRGKGFKKPEYFVCSRNVVFDTPQRAEKNFYQDTIGSNIWLDIDNKYNMRYILEQLLESEPEANWVTIQGEIFGAGVQKRDYNMKDRDIRVFNLIFSNKGRVGTLEMEDMIALYGLKPVPIVNVGMTLPSSIENLRAYVHSESSEIDGGMREGIVFRTVDGVESFKCVDPEFLIKFHQ